MTTHTPLIDAELAEQYADTISETNAIYLAHIKRKAAMYDEQQAKIDELVKALEDAKAFILARHDGGMAEDLCEHLSDVITRAKGE